jgi:predicted nucleic acid-binding protein
MEAILGIADVTIVETVAIEATANPAYPDSTVIQAFLKAERIFRVPTPKTPVDAIIDSYVKLGKGERDTLRLGIATPGARIVLDDHLAFVIATRFGVEPILLLDLLVLLVREDGLDKRTADAIIDQIAGRYSTPFVQHTKWKLSEE